MNLDDIQRRAREIFRQEAADLLVELEAALLDLEQNPAEAALINRVFRALHTLKGSGAISGYPELSTFLHHVEDVFNAARELRLTVTAALVNHTLEVVDAVGRYLAAPPESAAAVLTDAAPIVDRLLALLDSNVGGVPSARETPAANSGVRAPRPQSEIANTKQSFRIRFTPAPEFFQRGSDPAMFLDDLRALGDAEIECATDGVPALEELDPELCYLSWRIDLVTERDATAIRDIFAFVDDTCSLDIASAKITESPEWQVAFTITPQSLATPGLVPGLWRELDALGDVRVLNAPGNDRLAVGRWELAVTTQATEEEIAGIFIFALDAEPAVSRAGAPADQMVAPARPTAPQAESTRAAETPRERATAERTPTVVADAAKHDMLKVSADKLDRLVNLVGELVILRSQVSDACGQMAEVPAVLRGAAEGMERLASELRDVVLTVRMMPVRDSFAKFKRIVRDLSRELGKEVDLVLEGEETEMDKSMLEQLHDPLLHMVRNALDHGIETPDTRASAGKPRGGRLTLKAEQMGDRICITIADDGRGLDPAAIRAKAIAQGLLGPTESPTDAELFQLVFLPGFSTAKSVSQTSGRGVGMDVVKKRIELMRGTVALTSVPNRGTQITLSLPLTLAIIEGLMVEVDGERYVLPLSLVREIVERPRLPSAHTAGPNFIELRGKAVAVLHLREIFGLPPTADAVERILVVEIDGASVGLAVDAVLGSHQTVLKSLGWAARHVRIFSGATITGDGRVALILDINAVLAHSAATATAA